MNPPTPDAPSIWRPVSVRPTAMDASDLISVSVTDGKAVWSKLWNDVGTKTESHWCLVSDLLARAPLPKAKTQEELDREWIANASTADGDDFNDQMLKAIAYGRQTKETQP